MDEQSVDPVKQTFEKMVSSLYIGELVRQVIVELVWEKLLFQVIKSNICAQNIIPLF